MKPQKTLSTICAILIAFAISSCGETGNKSYNKTPDDQSTKTNEITTTTAATTFETTTTAQNTTTTKATTTQAPKVQYIGDRSVQFNDAKKTYEVLWQLSDQNNTPMKAPADVSIKIVNDNNTEVYNKTIQVTEKDYSNWSNKFRDEDFLLGAVEIPINDITPDSKDKGTLYFSVKGDGFSFEEKSFNVYYLPIKQVQISLPQVPLQVSSINWNDEIDTTLEISEIKSTHDDSTITLTFKCTMVYNKDGESEAQSGRFSYRLLDKDSVICDTGDIYTNSMRVGETTYVEKKFYNFDLDFTKDYTLELWNEE